MSISIEQLPVGITAFEAPFGGAPLLLYLIKGEKTVLVDTGVAETPQKYIFPYLKVHNMTMKNIDKVIVTHAHHDHFGGNYDVYMANPDIEFIAHEDDYEWMEDHQKHFNEMYLSYTDQWKPDAAYEKGVLDYAGPDAPITTVIKGEKSVLDIGNDTEIEMYHTGAHSPGEIILYIKKLDCVLTGDCIQVDGTLLESGVSVFPLFGSVERYTAALNKIRDLNCEYVCTAHSGILNKDEANKLIDASFEFLNNHQKYILETLENEKKPLSLHELADLLHERYYPNYEEAYQIHATTHAQCQYLKAQNKIKRVPQNGKLYWAV